MSMTANQLSAMTACLLVTLALPAQDEPKKPAKTGFTISKETTWFTEPVTKAGYIDYLAAINAKLKVGVTPENNAMVPLMQALGPKPESSRLHADFYQHLGVAELPEAGEYFIDLMDYARRHKLLKDDVNHNDLIDEWTTRITTRAWTKKEFPDLAKWVDANGKPLSCVAQAGKRTHYYLPFINKPFGQKDDDTDRPGSLMSILLPTVQRCRGLATVLLARAMLHAGEKEYQAAWDDLLTAKKLARVVARGATLIELLVGLAIDAVAAESALGLLEQTDCPKNLLQQMLKNVEQLPAMPGLADKISLGERSMGLETILLVHRYGPPYLDAIAQGKAIKGPLQDNKTFHDADWDVPLKRINAHYDRIVSVFSEPDTKKRRIAIATFDTDLKRLYVKTRDAADSVMRFLLSQQQRVELMADLMVALLTPAVLKVQTSCEKQIQRQRNLQVAIALAIYRNEKGAYPASLNDLTPAFLQSVPADYFNDKPLIYQKTDKGYRFYSVGPNGNNDEGQTQQDKPGCDDLPVTIPLPPLPKRE